MRVFKKIATSIWTKFIYWVILNFWIYSIKTETVQWNNSVEIKDIQYATSNTYNITGGDFAYQKGYITDSKAHYFAATAGSNKAVFSKQNSGEQTLWAKSYSPFQFYHQSFVVSQDDSAMYWIDEANGANMNILKINTSDGTLISQYIE